MVVNAPSCSHGDGDEGVDCPTLYVKFVNKWVVFVALLVD